jgi:hypothetical protein
VKIKPGLVTEPKRPKSELVAWKSSRPQSTWTLGPVTKPSRCSSQSSTPSQSPISPITQPNQHSSHSPVDLNARYG